MASLTLITGGSRSGKSSFAQRLAEERAGSRLFLATCPVTDPEMEVRILRHLDDNDLAAGRNEVPVDLSLLIESVYVSPSAEEWLKPYIEELLRRFDLGHLPVIQSDLYAENIE